MKYLHPKRIYRKLLSLFLYEQVKIRSFFIIRRLRKKVRCNKKIKVGFVASGSPSVDVYSGLYKYFVADERFECTYVVLPYTHDGEQNMLHQQEQSYHYLKSLGIDPILGYDKATKSFADYTKAFDIVFFEKEYDWVPSVFKAESYSNALSFHISYGPYLADNIAHHMSPKMMSVVYKILPTSSKDYEMLCKYSKINGRNVLKEFLGYPKVDAFFEDEENVKFTDVLTKAKPTQKKIIWAPHHTWANYSNFHKYSQFFLDYAAAHKDEIFIAFKPHPSLRASLREIDGWSEQQILDYYSRWETGDNTALFDAEWFDLFFSSDAMIMDSISFMMEYSLTKKPSCVLYREMENGEKEMQFSECGELIYDKLYHAKDEDDVLLFIQMIIRGEDPLYDSRVNLINEMYCPPNGKSASKNIYQYVVNLINKK